MSRKSNQRKTEDHEEEKSTAENMVFQDMHQVKNPSLDETHEPRDILVGMTAKRRPPVYIEVFSFLCLCYVTQDGGDVAMNNTHVLFVLMSWFKCNK